MNLIEHIHGGYAHKRRVHILSELLAPLIPKGAEVLDVGCGDGLLAHSISKKRPDIAIRGVDVFIRESTHVPVEAFDGKIIPYPDGSFDAVMFVDVLHHTEDPIILLREATRVGRRIIIKDHLLNGLFASSTLSFMDRIGNARHSVVLRYNYWPEDTWFTAFDKVGLRSRVWNKNLGLYPKPLDWIFGRSLHFIASLDRD